MGRFEVVVKGASAISLAPSGPQTSFVLDHNVNLRTFELLHNYHNAANHCTQNAAFCLPQGIPAHEADDETSSGTNPQIIKCESLTGCFTEGGPEWYVDQLLSVLQ